MGDKKVREKTVVKPEWGLKRACINCAVRFYDMNKKPITCPACGSVIEFATSTRGRKAKGDKAKDILQDDFIVVEDIDLDVEIPDANLDDDDIEGIDDNQ